MEEGVELDVRHVQFVGDPYRQGALAGREGSGDEHPARSIRNDVRRTEQWHGPHARPISDTEEVTGSNRASGATPSERCKVAEPQCTPRPLGLGHIADEASPSRLARSDAHLLVMDASSTGPREKHLGRVRKDDRRRWLGMPEPATRGGHRGDVGGAGGGAD